MKTFLFFISLLLISMSESFGQDSDIVLGDSHQPGEEAFRKQLLESILENRSFVFVATDMFPRGEAGIRLNYSCDVQLKDSIMVSYLPFMGRSYNLAPGQPNSGFDFTGEIEEYAYKKRRNGYQVKVDVKNGPDYLKYTFYITESGSSTLTVASTQRQSISFYGSIGTPR